MAATSSGDKFAYVTLVTSDDFVIGAQLLAYSLHKHHCTHPLLCLVTPNLAPRSLRLLTAASYTALLVHPLPCPFPSHNPAWTATGLTKLRLFTLHTLHYTRLLYIDADCLAATNLDHLFLAPHPTSVPFVAAPDLLPPDRFNAGVLLAVPNEAVWRHMLCGLGDGVGSYDGGDTGYLNSLYPQWYGAEAACRLAYRYNALRMVEWWTRKAARYWDEAVGDVSIVHYCSAPKVWEARKGGKLEQLWWAMHDEWQQIEAGKDAATALPPPAVIDLRQQPVLPAFSSPLLPFPASLLSVPFDAALTKRPIRFGVWSPDDRSWLSLLRARYERQAKQLNAQAVQPNDVEQTPPISPIPIDHHKLSPPSIPLQSASVATSIPRHIHHIWLGSPLPASYDRWLSSFRVHHPTWQHTLHTSLDSFPHCCPPSSPLHGHLVRLMAESTNYAEQSDILRLDVLLAYGGLYVDCDFECFAPFDALHECASIGLYCGMSNTGTVELNNGLIGARPDHPLLRRCIQQMRTRVTDGPSSVSAATDIISRTGPGHLTRTVLEYASSGVQGGADDVLLLPCTFFFPLANTLRGLQADEERWLFRRPESLAMHHWACSWQRAEASTGVGGSSSGGVKMNDGTAVKVDLQRLRDALPASESRTLPAGVLSRIGQFM